MISLCSSADFPVNHKSFIFRQIEVDERTDSSPARNSAQVEEPTLGELKRQLREQINATLGMKAIDDVIITNLSLKLPEPAVDTPVASSSDPAPEPAG